MAQGKNVVTYLDNDTAAAFDAFVKKNGYRSSSSCIKAAIIKHIGYKPVKKK